MAERWLPVPGYEGRYEVSDHGQVRGVDRIETYVRLGVLARRGHKGVLRVQGTTRTGRKQVTLCRGQRDHKRIAVHRLVLLAFVGPCPPGMECCHNDGNPANNHVSNLRWDTASANMLDKRRHGTDHHLRNRACPSGHLYDEANTYITPSGSRQCRKCRRTRRRPPRDYQKEHAQRKARKARRAVEKAA